MADKDWKKHMEAILVAVDKSTEVKAMNKTEALGFLNLLADKLATRQDALTEELENGDEEDLDGTDDELVEASEG